LDLGGVRVDVPAEVAGGGFVNGGGNRGKICGDVMFEAVFADVAEQFLEMRDFYYAGAAKGFEGIVGESAFTDVARDFSGEIVGGETRETHWATFYAADAGAESVVLADRARDDFLKVHADILKKMLRQIAAVEADGFIGIFGVIVVPVEEGAGRLRGELQGVHTNDASDVDFAGAGEALIAHHAHDRAGNDAEKFFERGPALNGADGDFGIAHPSVNDSAELGHLDQGSIGDALRRNVFADGGDSIGDFRVVVFEAGGSAHDFGEVERFDGDAAGFENFFAVTNGVERGGTRADGADAKPFEPFDDAANGEEPVEILGEGVGVGCFRVERGE